MRSRFPEARTRARSRDSRTTTPRKIGLDTIVPTVYTQYMDMHTTIVVSHADGRPMYLQIMEQIRLLVAAGEWQAGQAIPSIRQLAVDLQVSVITVKRAYMELERDGVIVTQQGRGSFVASVPDVGARLLEESLEKHVSEVVRLAELLGLSSDELAERIAAAAERHTRETA